MALRRDLTYPGRYSSATGAQPQGAFLNRTTPTSNDGSYPEQQWLNDWSALFSSLLVNAGITPNNAVDSVGDSQYFDALMQLISRPNVLINSDLTFANAINQRGVANWGAVALNDYGLDRWKKVDTSTIVQPIEQGNFIPNETYTLSWNNGADSRVIVAPTSGDWESSDLEIPITATGATKLELGKSRTSWVPELIATKLCNCYRYFISQSSESQSVGACANTSTIYIDKVTLPVAMRQIPSIKITSPSSITTDGNWGVYATGDESQWIGAGCSVIASPKSNNIISFRAQNVSQVSDGNCYLVAGGFNADAEI